MQDTIFGVVGGLALFLYGMGMLSDGLKAASGNRLRSLLGKMTRWPFVAMLVGAGATVLVQSSSATTVMVVGLINAGLLTLKQAISVILGANIGTTITAWIVGAVAGLKVLKISTYAMPFIAAGFVSQFFHRRPRLKTCGRVLMGLGLLFLGLALMEEALGALSDKQDSPFVAMLQTVGDQPLLAVLAGTLFTMCIQSSSASIAMVIVLATNGGFGTEWSDALRIAIPFVLGDNIGTTITAQFAALQTNINGKRTAMAHTLFNVLGVLLILPFVYTGLYARFVEAIYPFALTQGNIGLHIAIAHSAFNVIAALAIIPFVGALERLVLAVLPTRQKHMAELPVTLERHLLNAPPMAIDQSRREIVRMIRTAKEALDLAVDGIARDDMGALSKVAAKEDAVDDFQTEITRYLVELSQRNLDPEIANELPVLLHTVNDIERVGDHATNITEIAERKIAQKQNFSGEAQADIERMRREVRDMFDNVLLAVELSDTAEAEKALKHEETLNQMQVEFRVKHVERLGGGQCDVLTGLTFIDFVNNMEKIGDHLSNVAQAIIGGLQWGVFDEDAEADDAPPANPPAAGGSQSNGQPGTPAAVAENENASP